MFASTVKFFLSWQKAENEQRSKLQCATFIELLWSHKTCISDRFQCFNTWRPHSPQMWWTVYEAIPLGLPKWALELFGWQQQPLQSSLSNDCLTGLAESSLDFRLFGECLAQSASSIPLFNCIQYSNSPTWPFWGFARSYNHLAYPNTNNHLLQKSNVLVNPNWILFGFS